MNEEDEIQVLITVCQAVAPKTPERVPCHQAESTQVSCFDCKAQMWMHNDQADLVLKSKVIVVGVCSDCYRHKKASGDVLAEQKVAFSKPAWTTPN